MSLRQMRILRRAGQINYSWDKAACGSRAESGFSPLIEQIHSSVIIQGSAR